MVKRIIKNPYLRTLTSITLVGTGSWILVHESKDYLETALGFTSVQMVVLAIVLILVAGWLIGKK